jgi:hypothetical protein
MLTLDIEAAAERRSDPAELPPEEAAVLALLLERLKRTERDREEPHAGRGATTGPARRSGRKRPAAQPRDNARNLGHQAAR